MKKSDHNWIPCMIQDTWTELEWKLNYHLIAIDYKWHNLINIWKYTIGGITVYWRLTGSDEHNQEAIDRAGEGENDEWPTTCPL